jgi:hypothetical protein
MNAGSLKGPGKKCLVDFGGGHGWLVTVKSWDVHILRPCGNNAGRSPAMFGQGQLFLAKGKGDFAGLGVFDAVKAADFQVAVTNNLTTNQLCQLLQAIRGGHLV